MPNESIYTFFIGPLAYLFEEAAVRKHPAKLTYSLEGFFFFFFSGSAIGLPRQKDWLYDL